MLFNIFIYLTLTMHVLCTSLVLPNCSDDEAIRNIGCPLHCLGLVIVQPGSVILVIALPSLRHLVIAHLSIGLASQSSWSGRKCNWQVIVHVLHTVYICYRQSMKSSISRNAWNFQAFRVMPVTTSHWAIDHSAPSLVIFVAGWVAG